MIPNLDGMETGEELMEMEEPTRTYGVDFETGKIIGYIDDFTAAKQALYFILKTAQYEHDIYNHNYGLYTKDLFGQPKNYVYSELKRRIPEAILQDNRFTYVNEFEFAESQEQRGGILVNFIVGTIYEEEIKGEYEFTQKEG